MVGKTQNLLTAEFSCSTVFIIWNVVSFIIINCVWLDRMICSWWIQAPKCVHDSELLTLIGTQNIQFLDSWMQRPVTETTTSGIKQWLITEACWSMCLLLIQCADHTSQFSSFHSKLYEKGFSSTVSNFSFWVLSFDWLVWKFLAWQFIFFTPLPLPHPKNLFTLVVLYRVIGYSGHLTHLSSVNYRCT